MVPLVVHSIHFNVHAKTFPQGCHFHMEVESQSQQKVEKQQFTPGDGEVVTTRGCVYLIWHVIESCLLHVPCSVPSY